jgi:hypothetical protein
VTRIMRDSTAAADIPVAGTDIAAGYINGKYAWSIQDFARFVIHATIDINGSNTGADILDVETGDATVNGAVAWVTAKRKAQPSHYPPIIYCNRSTLTPLFNVMASHSLKIVTDFRLWVATLDGIKDIPDMTGVTAVQYAGQVQTKHHYDESIVYDNHWLASVAPVVKTALLVQHDFTSRLIHSRDGITWR